MCINLVRDWHDSFGLSESELMKVGLYQFEGLASKQTVEDCLSKAIANKTSEGIQGYIDLERSTSKMIRLSLNGLEYCVSLNRLAQIITEKEPKNEE